MAPKRCKVSPLWCIGARNPIWTAALTRRSNGVLLLRCICRPLAHCCPEPMRRHVRSWRKETYGSWPSERWTKSGCSCRRIMRRPRCGRCGARGADQARYHSPSDDVVRPGCPQAERDQAIIALAARSEARYQIYIGADEQAQLWQTVWATDRDNALRDLAATVSRWRRGKRASSCARTGPDQTPRPGPARTASELSGPEIDAVIRSAP